MSHNMSTWARAIVLVLGIALIAVGTNKGVDVVLLRGGALHAPLTIDLDWSTLAVHERATATVYGLQPDEQYTLDWGDGTVVYPQAGYGCTVDHWLHHRYAKAGSYTVVVKQRKQWAFTRVTVYELQDK